MPYPPSQKSRKNQSSNIVVTIKYGGLKATQFFSKYTTQAYKQLLNDLTELGFPHPKRSNIVFLSHGTLEIFWPIKPYGHNKSNFVTTLERRVNMSHEGSTDEHLALRKHLSIVNITMREDADYDPYLEHQASVPQAQSSKIQVPTPFNHSHSPREKPGERYHPYIRSRGQQVGWQPTDSSSQGYQFSQANPLPQTFNKRDAEMFLDEMETSLGAPIRPKQEPMEPVIPLLVHHPLSSPQSRRYSSRLQVTIQPEIQVKQEIHSPTLPLAPMHDQNHARTHIDLTRESEVQVIARHPEMAFPRHPSALAANGVPQHSRVQPSASTGATPVSTRLSSTDEIQCAPLSIPTPKSQDLPTIQRLTKELFELKGEITSAVERQNHIVEDLRRLSAAYVPSKLSVHSHESKNETTLKRRLQESEKELESERTKNSEVTMQLEIERAKRLEVEDTLKDVERECKSPFVVPALLEAFIEISQATTAAIRYRASSNTSS